MSPADTVIQLSRFLDGWNGEGSLAAQAATVSCAQAFASAIAATIPSPSIGLSEDGDIVFEWAFTAEKSLFARATGEELEVIAMDGDRDVIEISLSPLAAASVALGVVADWGTTRAHQAA